jgi:hypothetical protein
MSVKDALQTGLADVQGCAALAYVDMAADLVLATEAKRRRPQEFYNGLCKVARKLLHDSGAESVAKAATGNAEIATLVGASGAMIFVRSSAWPGHALCAVCDAIDDIPLMTRQVRAARDAVSQAL